MSFVRRATLVAIAALAACGIAIDARAEAPGDVRTLPCRPTIACTADLVPPGAFELEAGALFRKTGGGRQWTSPLLAKLTLTRWAQVQVGGNGYTLARGDVPAQFLDDVTAGLKLHVVDQSASAPSLSFSGTASVPTFRGEGYLRTYDALFTAYATKDFAWLHADLNVGANVWRLEGDPLAQPWAALALSVDLPDPFGAMVEAYAFGDAAPVAPRDGGLLFAISHGPTPWLLFDAGGDVGWFPSTRAYSVFFGMSIVPALLWRSDAPQPPSATRRD